jgi:O-antigen/teichoic acid export membrane protein
MSTAQPPSASRRAVFEGAIEGTFLYSIPLIGQRVASVLLLFIVTRVLTREDFGMLSLLEQVSFVLSILLCGSFSASLGYFYFQKNPEAERAQVVGTAIVGAFFLGSMAGLLGWPAMGILARDVFRSQDALRYLPIILIIMPFDFGGEAFSSWLRVEDRQVAFAKINLLRVALTVTGIVVLVGVLKMHVMAYLSTTLATHIVITGILTTYLLRTLSPRVSFSLFVRMLRFSVPIGLSVIAGFAMNFGDQFVLRHYRSLGEVGIYALAYRIGLLVWVANSSFQAYWGAQVYQILQREDADTVFARLFTYAILMVSLVTLMLTLGAEPGMRILVPADFRPAAPLIPVIAAANGIRSIGEFLRYRFLAAGRPGYKTYCDWAALVVCLVLYFLLIPRYGMWGAAIATLGTFVALAVISVAATYRMSPYQVEGVRLLKLGSVLAVVGILYYTVPVSSLVLQIGWSALLLALFPAGLWLLRFPTPGEWQGLRSAAQKLAGWRTARPARSDPSGR